MSLIKCPGCNSYISELETNCPSCDFLLTEEFVYEIRQKEKRENEKKFRMKRDFEDIHFLSPYR